MNQTESILSGIRVVELATYIFAPAAATVLSDFGAQVVKIERPHVGDTYRYLSSLPGMPQSPMNYCWLLDGRNKRSLALDLNAAGGREVLLRLLADADIFITNYQHSTLAKFDLEYDDLAADHPRLIYAHATGYGERGEERDKPGFDSTAYWARSGLMDAVRYPDTDPCLTPAGMGDHPSAMALVAGIMLALYDRARTGRGTKVSSSLLANGAWANSCGIQAYLCEAGPYVRMPRTSAYNPLSNHYLVRDGRRFVFTLIQPQKDWPNLCKAVGKGELANDARFDTPEGRTTNSRELIAILDEVLLSRDMAEWAAIFLEHELTWSPILNTHEAAHDAQIAANDIIIDYEHPRHGALRTVNSPVTLRGVSKMKPRPAPEIGEHTREVLAEAGFSEPEIAELLRAGTAATHAPVES